MVLSSSHLSSSGFSRLPGLGHPAPLVLQWLPALPGWLLHRVRTPLYVPPWSSQFPYVQKWVLKLPGLLFILSSIPPECLGSSQAGPHLPLWLGLFPLSPGVSWLAPVKYTSTQLVYLDEIIYLTPASFRMLLLGPVGSLACCTPTPLVCAPSCCWSSQLLGLAPWPIWLAVVPSPGSALGFLHRNSPHG